MNTKGRNFATTIGGKKVVNARQRVTLRISAKDARTGASKDPGACAAAKAAMREIPNCTMARIHLGRAYLFDNKTDTWKRYKTTDALRSEIIAFDRGGKFEPGTYDLRPLSPSDLEPKPRKKPGSSNPDRNQYESSQKRTPRKLHVTKGVRRRAS